MLGLDILGNGNLRISVQVTSTVEDIPPKLEGTLRIQHEQQAMAY